MRLLEARWQRLVVAWAVLTPLGAATEYFALHVPFVHGLIRMGAILGAVALLQYLFRYLPDHVSWPKQPPPQDITESRSLTAEGQNASGSNDPDRAS